MSQLDLPLDPETGDPIIELLSPHQIFGRITAEKLSFLSEDRRVEFKSSSIHFADLAKYYSMFSNTAPDGGVILFGVSDDGTPRGCKNLPSSLLNQLEKFHIQCCPLARPEIKRVPCLVDGKDDFLIAIYLPYIGKLVETNKSEACIRYGDSIHRMDDDEKREFRVTRQELPFELEPISMRYPEEFDLNIIDSLCSNASQIFGIERRTREEILAIKNLGEYKRGQFKPNRALALVAGRNVARLFPGCRLRIQRFDSISEGFGESYNPIVDRFIEGNVPEILKKASDVLDTLIYDYTWLDNNNKFVTVKEYPKAVWFEAIVNACVHRSYVFAGMDTTVKLFFDRMVIESPGGFCPPVTEKNIYDVRATRNPRLMDAMFALRYVKMAREGTRRMREVMAQAGLPEPIFKQETVHGIVVKVELRNGGDYRERVLSAQAVRVFGPTEWGLFSSQEKQIVEYIYKNGQINATEAQKLLDTTWDTAKKRLTSLVRRGYLVFQAAHQRDPAAHYRFSPPGSGKRVKPTSES